MIFWSFNLNNKSTNQKPFWPGLASAYLKENKPGFFGTYTSCPNPNPMQLSLSPLSKPFLQCSVFAIPVSWICDWWLQTWAVLSSTYQSAGSSPVLAESRRGLWMSQCHHLFTILILCLLLIRLQAPQCLHTRVTLAQFCLCHWRYLYNIGRCLCIWISAERENKGFRGQSQRFRKRSCNWNPLAVQERAIQCLC